MPLRFNELVGRPGDYSLALKIFYYIKTVKYDTQLDIKLIH